MQTGKFKRVFGREKDNTEVARQISTENCSRLKLLIVADC